MSPAEVMLSESQERMVLSVEPEGEAELLALLEHWELDAVVIGEVTQGDRLRILDGDALVGNMPVAALNEAPTYTRKGVESREVISKRETPVDVPLPENLNAVLLRLLASPTISSKRAVFERYDYQVQTNTVVVPGAADAAVLRVKGTTKGVAATVGLQPAVLLLRPLRGRKARRGRGRAQPRVRGGAASRHHRQPQLWQSHASGCLLRARARRRGT